MTASSWIIWRYGEIKKGVKWKQNSRQKKTCYIESKTAVNILINKRGAFLTSKLRSGTKSC